MADIPNIGYLSGNESMDEVIDHVAKLQKMVEFLATGNLSSVNAREFGGWRVNLTELRSLDGDVGLSTADDADDPVRLWAGSTDKETAPWRVTKSGKEHSTGATIESSAGYPKYLLDPDTGKIKFMFSEDTYLEIVPNYDGTSPAINYWSSGAQRGQIIVNGSGQFEVSGAGGLKLVGGDIVLEPDDVTSGRVRIGDFSLIVNSLGTDLQSALNSKANGSGASGTYYVATASGGDATTPITVSNGIIQP